MAHDRMKKVIPPNTTCENVTDATPSGHKPADLRRSILIQPSSFALLGFFLTISYGTLLGHVLWGPLVAQTSLSVGLVIARRTLEALGFLGIALCRKRLAQLSDKRSLLLFACTMCTMAALLSSAARMDPSLLVPAIAAGLIGFVAHTLLWMAWAELYARMDMLHVIVLCLLAHACSALLSFPTAHVAVWCAGVTATLAPALSVLLLQRASGLLDAAGFSKEKATDTVPCSFPTRPVALMASFSLCNQFVRSGLAQAEQTYAMLGVILVCSGTAVVALRRGMGRFNLWMVAGLAFTLELAGAFGPLLNQAGPLVAASVCTTTGSALFSTFITVTLCNVPFRYGTSALFLFGVTQAAERLASLAGQALSWTSAGWNQGAITCAVMATCLLLALTYVLAMTHGTGDVAPGETPTWGATSFRNEGGGTSEAEIERRCSTLARAAGLTRREEEVLLLLAQDLCASDIQARLILANATVKTHTQAVYRKLGVHSRQEVVDLVQGQLGK